MTDDELLEQDREDAQRDSDAHERGEETERRWQELQDDEEARYKALVAEFGPLGGCPPPKTDFPAKKRIAAAASTTITAPVEHREPRRGYGSPRKRWDAKG